VVNDVVGVAGDAAGKAADIGKAVVDDAKDATGKVVKDIGAEASHVVDGAKDAVNDVDGALRFPGQL